MRQLDSAPKDGTPILLRVNGVWHEGGWQAQGRFRPAGWVICSDYFEGGRETPFEEDVEGWVPYP
jgi:hypothetical protein